MGQFEIKGFAFDSENGGLNIDAAIAKFLADAFLKQTGINLKNNIRAMTRLFLEAKRHKEILTANEKTFLVVCCTHLCYIFL